MRFWPFTWRSKTSKNQQKQKPVEDREKMAQAGSGGAESLLENRDERQPHINSKRRRMEKSSPIPPPAASDRREKTAATTSTRDDRSGTRQTPATPTGQTEKQDISSVAREGKLYQHNPTSNSSFGPDHFAAFVTPTLHAKRENNSTLPRRKSSKRKAEEQARERELRAKSSPIPIPKRPLSFSDGPLRRDTRRAPDRLGRHGDRHASDLSLPIPESLSDIGPLSNQNSFTVHALDMFSPRPTIRYNKTARATPSRSNTTSRNSARPVIEEEEDFSSKKRIENLADGLDAGGLRELMERDQRRRERKRKTDQARLEQKLRRRAEYEKEQEARGLGESRGEEKKGTSELGASGPATVLQAPENDKDLLPDPFSDDNIIELDLPAPPVLRPGSSIYTRASQASFSPPASPSQRGFDPASLSQTSALRGEITPERVESAEVSRRPSEQNPALVASWSSFFKRGGSRGKGGSLDRGRHGSAEFSNTSRDSIVRNQPPTALGTAPRTFRRSGTPQRTQSKFREDLPELPLSPPDSRVQSPEAGTAAVDIPGHSDQVKPPPELSTPFAASSGRMALLQKPENDGPGHSQTSEGPTTPPVAVLSRSLGSVDSEASWLSGKPTKRSSITRDHPLRKSQSSLPPNLGDFDVYDEADVVDDPYFSRLSPEPGERRRSSPISTQRKASSTALNLDPESDREGEGQVSSLPESSHEKWHSTLGRQPTLVRQAAQARSKEGLLKEYTDAEKGVVDDADADADASELESPEFEDADLPTSGSPILRAQSVNLGGGHVRHISAGSAKLLDIRHPSVDSKVPSVPQIERPSTSVQSPGAKEEKG